MLFHSHERDKLSIVIRVQFRNPRSDQTNVFGQAMDISRLLSLFPSMRENQRYLLQYYTIGFCEFHLDKFICLFPLATWCDNILPENKENSVHSISSVGREMNLFVMIFIWFKHLRSTSGGFLFSCAFWNQDDLAKNIHVCNQIT